MNWDKLDIHIENFAPGLATVWAVSLFWSPPSMDGDASKAFLAIALLGAAYLLGVLVNVLCRVMIDPASEHCTRAYVFKAFSKDKLRDMAGASRHDINKAYNYYCFRAISEAKETAKEVAKRRQTGRLLRSSLVPILLVQLNFSVSMGMSFWATGALMVAGYVILLLLYGYAEATVLHEAFFAVPPQERSVSAINKILEEGWTEVKHAEPAPAGDNLPMAFS